MNSGRRAFLQKAVYLLEPDSGNRERIAVEIAGVPVDLWTGSPEIRTHCLDYFAGYRRSSGEPRLEIFADHLPASPELPESLWEDEDPEFDIRGEVVIQRDFVARRLAGKVGPERIVAWLSPVREDAIHNLMRWSLTPALLDADSFLLHGAAVVKDGRGYVFFGQSGAGKSTTAGLIADADPAVTLLGDDGVIIRAPRDGSTPCVYAAPLGAGYSRAAPPSISAPIRGLFALEQSTLHRIQEFSVAEGVATLLASAMNTLPGASLEERFELAIRFALAPVGIRRLKFARNAGFWRMLQPSPRGEFHDAELE